MDQRNRKISAGTIVMLAASLLILCAAVYVMARLSSGAPVDLTRLRPGTVEIGTQEHTATAAERLGQPTAAPATAVPAAEEIPVFTEQPGKSFTLTAGGTVSLAGEVRTNSYYSDVKQYDYYDIMTLLRKELRSDVNIVFLENILSTDQKANDVIAAGAAASMMKAAGINAAACGFSKAFEKTETGIQSTLKLLTEYGIRPVGIYESGASPVRITEINGIRTAILQYTDTIPAATRKSMIRNGQAGIVPAADAEFIADNIKSARDQGCDVVIVLLQWGKTGKAPDKNQRALAQKIADAGADLIIGCGSRIVSGAETLTAANDGKQVLCVWSLGTVLSGDRSNIKRIAGMLLHVTVYTENGKTEIRDWGYTPLYTWKYKMDGRYYYRCMAANGNIPDGMDADQQKSMKKAADAVREAMKNSGVEERGIE